ncbi:MAG: aldo/keto reductase, partial [Hylemonella sp.]|nr:aldo/keto reductase [Hylemonella sp.]
HGMTPAQAGLAWLLGQEGVIAIPKSSSAEHVRENAAARDITLSVEQRAELDRLFAPPSGPSPLEML